jgi:hypothetical protein
VRFSAIDLFSSDPLSISIEYYIQEQAMTINLPNFDIFPLNNSANLTQDAGETFSTAFELGLLDGGINVDGSLTSTDLLDIFKFSLAGTQEISILLNGLSSDADVEIFDINGESLGFSNNAGTVEDSLNGVLDEGTYYLAVSSYDGVATDYNLDLITTENLPPEDGEEFNIAITFGRGSEGLSEAMADAVIEAAQFWEDAITTSSLSGDHTLTIEVGGTVQAPGVLASAGPDPDELVNDVNGNLMPILGASNINTNPDTVNYLSSNIEFFTRVMIHEFGHVMGIGTLWEVNNLIDPTTATYNANTYAGIAYGELLDTDTPTAIPLTTGVGPGSDLRHWDEGIFSNELMTYAAEDTGTSMPASIMTLASLQDLGWNVNYDIAEIYPDGFSGPETASLSTGVADNVSSCGCTFCGSYSSNILSDNLFDAIATQE